MADARARFVLLGASNATLLLPRLVAAVRARAGAPLEILSAHGHGRSYGTSSRVLGLRELESIGTCGLWRALESRADAPLSALVMDIGNDLAYGRTPATVAAWIERDVVRLRALGARLRIARVPLASVEALSAWRFHVARTLLFPTRTIELATIRRDLRELDRRIVLLARAHGADCVDVPAHWFTLDPIHVARGRRAEAVEALLGPFGTRAAPLRLRGLRPAARRLFGSERRCAQPCVRLHDGSTIAWY